MQRSLNRRARMFAVVAAVAVLGAGAAYAQSPVTFVSERSVAGLVKSQPKIAIPSYELTFITAQQATSVANIEARARLTTVMAGVEPAVMKRLANEAHADLKAKLTAAGVPLLDDAATRAAAAGSATLPGNMEVKPLTAGVTIGKGVQLAWASFGADAAPAIAAYHNPNASPTANLAQLSAARALGPGIKANGATMVIPSLVFDFVNSGGSTGTGMLGNATANVNAKLGFSLRAQTTVTSFVTQAAAGPAYGIGLRFAKDITSATPFATVAQGEAAVRALSTGSTDGLGNRNSRGDAAVVNVPVWEGLVRQSFQDYNAALVAAIVKSRG